MNQTSHSKPIIAVVIPCYNEEDSLPITLPILTSILERLNSEGAISQESFILCCNDGSTDRTWQILKEQHASNPSIRAISLAHNRGHQFALLAGLMYVVDKCDAAISIDADLQDDPEAIVEMVNQFNAGKEIVYGVRSSRKVDSFFKRTTAHMFYSFQKIMGVNTIYDHADYRLMSKRALDILSQYGEANIFLRGIVPQIGLETAIVTYERKSRCAGESKYPLKKMLALSIDGITSFSAVPMRWIFYTGLLTLLFTIIVGVYIFVSYFTSRNIMAGWTSVMLSIWGLGSLILMSLGIIGEYIGKIFNEVKRRPRYNIKDTLWD